MNIGIIGGGINGIFISYGLSKLGYKVDLYEQGKVLSRTSSSSSKLLHGGIRYLEQGHINLVRESLNDRAWWIKNASEYAKPIKICMPIYNNSPRSIVKVYAGAFLYRILAGSHSLGPSRFYGKSSTLKNFSEIKVDGLIGSVTFFDAQMNEQMLGQWVFEKSKNEGTKVFEDQKVNSFTSDGIIKTDLFGEKKYDLVINAAGPWAADLNKKNGINSKYYLRLIRGSHLIFDHKISNYYLFQESDDGRVVFVLPYLGKTMVGTTEIPQNNLDDPVCSKDERNYLLNIYNQNLKNNVSEKDIESEFSGLRPIVGMVDEKKQLNFSNASRDSEIEVCGKLISVYGGKWTSAPSLFGKIVKILNI